MSITTEERQFMTTETQQYRAWQLHGAGLENIGTNGEAETVELRPPAANEVMLKVDAVGLCQSDIKIIKQGGAHARLRGRDLKADPTVLGHECAATVEAVGDQWKDKFTPGQRFIVQADIYYKGIGYAFGYVIPGGLAQYCYVDERALDGDEGCYLLPVDDNTGFSQSALAEPWACVEMAYAVADRLAPSEGEAFVWGDGNSEGDALEDIVVQNPTPQTVEAAANRLAKNGNLYLLGQPSEEGSPNLDIGRIHYEGIRFLGGADTLEGIAAVHTRNDLRPGGAALFIGAGGPMGQMHVQRALERADGPALVVATDLDRGRLDHIARRFAGLLERREVQFELIDSSEFENPAAEHAALQALAPDGYDDLVTMAPVASLVTGLCELAAPNALLNVFAGVPIGQSAPIPLKALCNGVRIVGTSGSRIEDMQSVLDKVQGRELDTNLSVAAVGGLEAAHDGLRGLLDARFPGKTVIYPQVSGLPLTPLDELNNVRPDVAKALGPDNAWTIESERLLMESE
jgi:threonine dehydrogenase-like Zn-dependent dehydrogenase